MSGVMLICGRDDDGAAINSRMGRLRISPVSLLELGKLEADARRAAAEVPLYAPLAAAVSTGGLTRLVGADGVCVYDGPGDPAPLQNVLEDANALDSIANYDRLSFENVLGIPRQARPELGSLVEAAEAILALRSALTACVDVAAGADFEESRRVVDAARERHKHALHWLWRLPPPCAEEVECARTYVADALAVIELRQTIAWCDEDNPHDFRDDTPDDVPPGAPARGPDRASSPGRLSRRSGTTRRSRRRRRTRRSAARCGPRARASTSPSCGPSTRPTTGRRRGPRKTSPRSASSRFFWRARDREHPVSSS